MGGCEAPVFGGCEAPVLGGWEAPVFGGWEAPVLGGGEPPVTGGCEAPVTWPKLRPPASKLARAARAIVFIGSYSEAAKVIGSGCL